jgi:hypothetical protein
MCCYIRRKVECLRADSNPNPWIADASLLPLLDGPSKRRLPIIAVGGRLSATPCEVALAFWSQSPVPYTQEITLQICSHLVQLYGRPCLKGLLNTDC